MKAKNLKINWLKILYFLNFTIIQNFTLKQIKNQRNVIYKGFSAISLILSYRFSFLPKSVWHLNSYYVITTSSEWLRWIWGWINNHMQCWEIKKLFFMNFLVAFKVKFSIIVLVKNLKLVIRINRASLNSCCCWYCWLFIGFLFGKDYKAAIMSWTT